MTRHLEDDRTIYSGILDQLRYDKDFIEDFFDVRTACTGELKGMQQLTERMHSVAPYVIFGGGIPIESSYWYQSALSPSLAEALTGKYTIHGDDQMFVVDSQNHVVLSGSHTLVPRVAKFTRQIETAHVYTLPEKHNAIKLLLLAEHLIDKVNDIGGDYRFLMLLLGEGFHDDLEHITRALMNDHHSK